MSEIFTAELFLPQVGELFQVGETELSLTLVQVDTRKAAPGQGAPFTLIFRGPKSPWAPENIWAMKAPDGTVHEIYIAPIQTHDPDCQDYQAIFS